MKFPRRVKYALRVVLDIFHNQKDGPVSIKKISTRTGISAKYMEQMMVGLQNNMLIRSISGRGGGYLLNKPPDSITIGAIVEATIGPVALTDCTAHPDLCIRSGFCECSAMWLLLTLKINEVLHGYSLQNISSPEDLFLIRKELEEFVEKKI